MQKPPLWINTDQITVNTQNKISLSFSIDPLSEILRFRLERKSGLSGVFKTIALPVASNGKVKFTDIDAHTDSIYYYRLSAINNCANPVMVSDIASNIVLSLEKTGNNLNFSWNSFKKSPEHLLSGKLYINSGEGYKEKSSIAQGDTTFTLDYNQIMYEITDREVCFYISVSETSNPYGDVAESFSSRVCTFPYEVITVPNVFTPNSGTTNALFRPVLSFTPKDYHLVITNRQGKVLFETNDYLSVWDGIQNGTPQAQDVFLWYLKVITPSGKSISKTGTITIIHK
jgi:gliding motility-associated-like protein